MVQAHGGADLRADPQAEHQRLYLKLLGVYELAKADAEAEEKEHAPKRHKASGSQNDPICLERRGGRRQQGGGWVGRRLEGGGQKGAREQGCSERERRVQGGGRRERWVQGEQPPPPPHIKCVILRIQRGYLMHKYLGHRYFIAQVFRIRILGSSLYLYLYFGYRRYPCVTRLSNTRSSTLRAKGPYDI